MKFSVKRFRTSRTDTTPAPPTSQGPVADDLFAAADDGFGNEPFDTARGSVPPAATPDADAAPALEAIRAEGLTTRQLRLARRVAQHHNLAASSDEDAVRVLRNAGIDPFAREELLQLVQSDAPAPDRPAGPRGRVQLPQTARSSPLTPVTERAEATQFAELLQMQKDIARRRKRNAALLAVRLLVFVGFPTLIAGYYFYFIATPLYSAKSEFVIQQADSAAGGGGLGSLFRGTQIATSQDSIAVQGFLTSLEAMQRLDTDVGFRQHFSQPQIDAIQKLAPDATLEDAYKIYKRNVKIGYDTTEGILRMQVNATDPESAVRFSNALIGYAEDQIDHLTQRLREDQMDGARDSYDQAEANMIAAQQELVRVQQTLKVMSSQAEVGLITSQIGALETQLTNDRLALEQMMQNESPNVARMGPITQRVETLTRQIASLRARMTETGIDGVSLAEVQGQLLVAEANMQTRQLLLAQSLQAMEAARIEANRQVRYLSVSVQPVQPERPSFPRAFENTMVALFLFAGIYLMITMTFEVLREQMSA